MTNEQTKAAEPDPIDTKWGAVQLRNDLFEWYMWAGKVAYNSVSEKRYKYLKIREILQKAHNEIDEVFKTW